MNRGGSALPAARPTATLKSRIPAPTSARVPATGLPGLRSLTNKIDTTNTAQKSPRDNDEASRKRRRVDEEQENAPATATVVSKQRQPLSRPTSTVAAKPASAKTAVAGTTAAKLVSPAASPRAPSPGPVLRSSLGAAAIASPRNAKVSIDDIPALTFEDIPKKPAKKTFDFKARMQDLEDYGKRLEEMLQSDRNLTRTYYSIIEQMKTENTRLIGEEQELHALRLDHADLFGRHTTMAAETASLREQLNAEKTQCGEWKVRATSLQHLVEKRDVHIQEIEGKLVSSERQVHELTESLCDMQSKLKFSENQYANKCSELSSVQAEFARVREQLTSELELTRRTLRDEINSLRCELTSKLDATQSDLAFTRETLRTRENRIVNLENGLADSENTVAELIRKRHEDAMLRKQLHNAIQELKGNVRVYARIRPANVHQQRLTSSVAEDDAYDYSEHYQIPENKDQHELVVIGKETTSAVGDQREGKRQLFSFDRIFGPGSSQSEVFSEISQLVQSALDGYNVCIFAYGQTGSGKTFTMEGPLTTDHVDESAGMIPRSVAQIFATAEKLRELEWTYEFEASFVEIYNENLRDLLAEPSTSEERSRKLDIKLDAAGNTAVPNLTAWPVKTPDQCLDLLRRASDSRAWAATKMNAHSSRSHSVFQLRIRGRNSATDQTLTSVLNLVDLAGSERLAQSGATGDRLKETQHINKSLSALGDVVAALASQAQHIPFRNSRLTHLLQNYLGGSSKTLMFVNISPDEEHLNESVNSLRFATKVNSCEIGVARRKINNNSSS